MSSSVSSTIDSTISSVGVNPSSNTSHPTGFWFFFWGEFAERCSYYGMRAILALYMIDRLGVDEADAGTYMSLFIAACYFFPLVGGWIADNYLGKYWTIVLFSIPYVIAQFIVGIENQYVVFAALVLLAMGSGVIKPNISTLMGMTYEQQRPGQDQLLTSAFSWFYMAINIGAALSQFAMPWLRDVYGYQIAFFFPAVLMAIALVIFALGKKYYAVEVIDRRTLSLEEAATDRKLKIETLSRIGAVFLLVMFFWAIFDQAASTWIFFAKTYMDCTVFGQSVSPDAIQAFNPVFIILLVPVSVAIFKVVTMKATTKMLIGFLLTAVSMVIMSASGYLAGTAAKKLQITTPGATIVISEELSKSWGVEPDKLNDFSKSTGELMLLSGKSIKESDFGAMAKDPTLLAGAGIVELVSFSAAKSTVESAPEALTVSGKMIDWVLPSERVTVWWQILAYLILTVAEILISVTGLELAFVAAPPSMKSFVTACWLAVVFLANLLINAPITRLYSSMSPGLYFAMLAVAMVIVSIAFVFVAKRFNASEASA
jgi:POT family proton-dependent oligopeptide transporter